MCARQYALPRYTCLSTCRHSVSQKIVWQRKTKTPRAKKNPLYKSKSYPIYWCIIISVVSLSLAGAMHDALAVVGAIVIPLNSFIVARECEFVCAPPNILFGDGRRCIVLCCAGKLQVSAYECFDMSLKWQPPSLFYLERATLLICGETSLIDGHILHAHAFAMRERFRFQKCSLSFSSMGNMQANALLFERQTDRQTISVCARSSLCSTPQKYVYVFGVSEAMSVAVREITFVLFANFDLNSNALPSSDWQTISRGN